MGNGGTLQEQTKRTAGVVVVVVGWEGTVVAGRAMLDRGEGERLPGGTGQEYCRPKVEGCTHHRVHHRRRDLLDPSRQEW